MQQTLDIFQHDIIAFGNRRGRIIYADPMGARKTATTVSWLRQRDDAAHILLVVPGAVVQHWISQAERWYPELEVVKGVGAADTRHRRLSSLAGGPVAYVTTYDSMKADEDLIAEREFDTVIFDEGHRLKGRTTAVSRCAFRVTAGVKNIWCVTGTPILNAPEEMWFYLRLLFRRTFKSFWQWAEENFEIHLRHYGRTMPVREIGKWLPGREAAVREQLSTVLIQRELDELYDIEEHPWIEEAEFHPVDVQLSEAEQRHYDKLVKHAWTQLPSGKVIKGSNKLAVTTRLKQLSSDWGTVDDTLGTGSKVTMAAGLVNRLAADGPVVVFTEFKETAHRLAKTLNEQTNVVASTYTSDTPDKEYVKERFIDGTLDCIVGTYGSMREGTDGLQAVSHQMVLVDLLWVPGLIDQAVGRLRRDGQTHRVHVWLLACAGTIDFTVLRANLRKVNVTNTFKGQDIEDVIYGRSFDIEVEDED